MDLPDAGPPSNQVEPSTLEEENLFLKAKLKETTVELNQAKSRLMALQGETDKIQDSSISKGFEQLCDAIERWIDNVDRDERRNYFQGSFVETLNKRPEELSNLVLGQVDSKSDFVRWMDWLGGHDTCNFVIISMVIWSYLLSKVFNDEYRKYPLAVAEYGYATDLFDQIQAVFEKKYERRETSLAADKWKSETLLSLLETERFTYDRKRYVVGPFSEELHKRLRRWISSDTLSRHQSSLSDDIILPASELQSLMACSQSNYVWRSPKIERDKDPLPEEAQAWTLKEISFWRPAKYKDIEGVFQCLFPAIHRIGKGNEGNRVVVKPVVLAYRSGPRHRDEFRSMDGQGRKPLASEPVSPVSGGTFFESLDSTVKSVGRFWRKTEPRSTERNTRGGSPKSGSQSQESSSKRSAKKHRSQPSSRRHSVYGSAPGPNSAQPPIPQQISEIQNPPSASDDPSQADSTSDSDGYDGREDEERMHNDETSPAQWPYPAQGFESPGVNPNDPRNVNWSNLPRSLPAAEQWGGERR